MNFRKKVDVESKRVLSSYMCSMSKIFLFRSIKLESQTDDDEAIHCYPLGSPDSRSKVSWKLGDRCHCSPCNDFGIQCHHETCCDKKFIEEKFGSR